MLRHNKKDVLWKSQLRYYSSVVSGITKKRTRVQEAMPPVLGCTDNQGRVYIAREHPLFDEIKQEITAGSDVGKHIVDLYGGRGRKKEEEFLEDVIGMIRLGVLVHEALHQILTNFDYFHKFLEEKMKTGEIGYEYELQIFAFIQNIIEDPAIEAFGPQYVGGVAIKALRFAIAAVDVIQGDFNIGKKSAYQELTQALIQFGDMGVIHGEFQFPEAKSAFAKIAPAFYDAINEPDNKKRVDKSWDIFLDLKSLWQNKSREEMEDFMKQVKEAFENLLRNDPDILSKRTKGQSAKPQPQNSKINQKRTATIKKVTREEYEKAKEQMQNQDPGDIPDDAEAVMPLPEDFNEDDARELLENALNSESSGQQDGSSLPIPGSSSAPNQQQNASSGGNQSGQEMNQSGKSAGSSQEAQDGKSSSSNKEGGDKAQDGFSKNREESDTASMNGAEGSGESDAGSNGHDQIEATESGSEGDEGESKGRGIAGDEETEETSGSKEDGESVEMIDGEPEEAGDGKDQTEAGTSQAEGSSDLSEYELMGEENPAMSGKEGSNLDSSDLLNALDSGASEGSGMSPHGISGCEQSMELSEEEIALLEEDTESCFSENDFDSVLNGLTREREAVEEEMADAEEYYSEIQTYSDALNEAAGFEGVQAINRYVENNDGNLDGQYDSLVERITEYFEPFKDEIDGIFEADRARKEYAESGKKVNISRVALHKGARVFERKTLPGHKNDVAFCIAVDNSGSTNGDKNIQEKIACVGIAEALSELEIPLYIFGFNTYGSTPIQTHYVRWDNSRFERERLLCMQANGCNFDSYSIRYATKLLEERPERSKMLIVVSDGCPSSGFSWEEGLRQNALAVENARNIGIKVLGMSVGDDIDEADFVRMYGRDGYVSVVDPSELFDTLSERIKTVIEEG